jgi:hypothetical protein
MLRFTFNWLKTQVGQGGLMMACKKAFLPLNHAQTRDKSFYLDFPGKIFGTGKSLAKLLNTDSGYYLYDTGTNKILGCRKQVFELLAGKLDYLYQYEIT